MTLNEKDFKLFKKWLKSHIAFGPTTITFTKKDGTERVMRCTTNAEQIPYEPVMEDAAPKKEKKTNEEVMPVYDLDAKGWRSFRWDSVKQVSFSIGEE